MEFASNRGVTIDYIDYLLFRGELPGENRVAHTGVFKLCVGDIEDNVSYAGIPITTRNIEDLILNEYQFRDIIYNEKQFVVR